MAVKRLWSALTGTFLFFAKLSLEYTPLISYSGGSNFGTVSSFVESSDYSKFTIEWVWLVSQIYTEWLKAPLEEVSYAEKRPG